MNQIWKKQMVKKTGIFCLVLGLCLGLLSGCGKAEELLSSDAASSLMEEAGHAASTVKEEAAGVADSLKEAAAEAASSAAEAVNETVSENLSEWMEQAGEKAMEAASSGP